MLTSNDKVSVQLPHVRMMNARKRFGAKHLITNADIRHWLTTKEADTKGLAKGSMDAKDIMKLIWFVVEDIVVNQNVECEKRNVIDFMDPKEGRCKVNWSFVSDRTKRKQQSCEEIFLKRILPVILMDDQNIQGTEWSEWRKDFLIHLRDNYERREQIVWKKVRESFPHQTEMSLRIQLFKFIRDKKDNFKELLDAALDKTFQFKLTAAEGQHIDAVLDVFDYAIAQLKNPENADREWIPNLFNIGPNRT